MTIIRDLLKEFNSKILFFLALIFTIGILFSFSVYAFQKPGTVKMNMDLFYVKSENPAGNIGFKNVLYRSQVETNKTFQIDQKITSDSSNDYTKFFGNYPSVNVIATGYTAGKESTGKNPGDASFGITKSGVKVRRSLYSTVAADPNIFPIGTILYIPGYGLGVVADTGSKIHGHHLDLYFQSVDDVYKQWGKRTLDVYIIKKGSGHLTEAAMKQLNHQRIEQVIHERPSYGM